MADVAQFPHLQAFAERVRDAGEHLAGTDNSTDHKVTAAHLADGALHHTAHALQHLARLEDDDVKGDPASTQFNQAHAVHHVRDAQDHMARLAQHLAENPSDPTVFEAQRERLHHLRKFSVKEPSDADGDSDGDSDQNDLGGS